MNFLEAQRLTAGNEKRGRSRDEIACAIRDFSAADWVRLKKVSLRYSNGRSITAEDLRQEAYARALDGRVCPKDVDVVHFLCEAMHSIAHGEQEKVANKVSVVGVSGTDEISEQVVSVPDPSGSAEERIIRDEEGRAIEQSVVALFADDDIAQVIVEGIMDGLEGEELRELCGLDGQAYGSKRRFIRRRIDKAFPEGWKL